MMSNEYAASNKMFTKNIKMALKKAICLFKYVYIEFV